jgi:hypothetical protein
MRRALQAAMLVKDERLHMKKIIYGCNGGS